VTGATFCNSSLALSFGTADPNGNMASTSLRSNYRISMHRPAEDRIEPWLNLRHAAALVGVAPRTLRIAAERGEINALHPLEDGPWIFQRTDLEGTAAQALALRAQGSPRHPTVSSPNQQDLFPSTT
jgi:hypothetical protein